MEAQSHSQSCYYRRCSLYKDDGLLDFDLFLKFHISHYSHCLVVWRAVDSDFYRPMKKTKIELAGLSSSFAYPALSFPIQSFAFEVFVLPHALSIRCCYFPHPNQSFQGFLAWQRLLGLEEPNA